MNNFYKTVQNNLKNLKNYVDKRLNNLSSSQLNRNTESNQNNEI